MLTFVYKYEDYSDYNKVLFSTVALNDPPFWVFMKLADDNRTVSLKLIRKADTVWHERQDTSSGFGTTTTKRQQLNETSVHEEIKFR